MSNPVVLVLSLLLWPVVLLETAALWALSRRLRGRTGETSVEELAPGDPAPRLAAADTRGERCDLGAPGSACQALLVLNPGAAICRLATTWLPEFLGRTDLRSHAVVTGSRAAVRRFAQRYEVRSSLVPDPGGRIAAVFRVPEIPYLLVLNPAGKVIASGSPRVYEDVCGILQAARAWDALSSPPGEGGRPG